MAKKFLAPQQSRQTAREETKRQTGLLMSEIEARRRTDAALRKARQVAEAANLAKSRYVTGLSHGVAHGAECDPWLRAVAGARCVAAAAPRDGIRIIRRSGEHLAGLIEGLLDISKIKAGRIELYRDTVRLPDFLDQLSDMFQLQASAKGIIFIYTHEGWLPALVRTDERRLRQILINLLSNAIKFTQHGQVVLRVRWRNELADFEIEDTGIGIAAEHLERVFEPFQRIESPRAPYTPGVGLGLTITRLLTQIMGGEILIDSQPGRGTIFRVRLMLSEVHSAGQPAAVELHVQGYAGPRRCVLVADDDPFHRGLIEDLLVPLGFVVLTAADAAECLRVAAQTRPDLFLLDIAMPGMNGWQLARQLRSSGFATVPVLMVSAAANISALSYMMPWVEYSGKITMSMPGSAFKAALIHYAQGLAFQLAGKGIRANTLSRGNTYFPGGRLGTDRAGQPGAVRAILGAQPDRTHGQARGGGARRRLPGQPGSKLHHRNQPRRGRRVDPWRPVLTRSTDPWPITRSQRRRRTWSSAIWTPPRRPC